MEGGRIGGGVEYRDGGRTSRTGTADIVSVCVGEREAGKTHRRANQ